MVINPAAYSQGGQNQELSQYNDFDQPQGASPGLAS
jgi:hypothetical protein